MSKKKSSQGKGNGAPKSGSPKSQLKGAPTVRRPPRHQGR